MEVTNGLDDDEVAIIVETVYDDGIPSNHWDGDQILLNTDGSVASPFGPSNGYIFSFNCICCLVGVVASARVFYKVVVLCKEDAWRPRHVLLIGNIVSCILTLFVHCLIPAVYFCFPDVFICRFFIAIYRLPYIAFLLNNFLSLVDRFVAVTRSTWHRLTLTKWYCAAWLAVLNLALAVAVKWMYIGQFKSVECAFHLSHSITLIVTILILSVLNTVALAAVFIATWRQLPTAARAIPVPFIPPPVAAQPGLIDNAPTCAPQPNPVDIVYVSLRDLLPVTSLFDDEEKSIAKSVSVSGESQMFKSASAVDASSVTLRRMELEVTKHSLFTFIPLAFVIIPCLIPVS